MQLLVDGGLLPVEPVSYAALETGGGQWVVSASTDAVLGMAEAERIVGRICELEFRIGPEARAVLAELAARVREERAFVQAAAARP